MIFRKTGIHFSGHTLDRVSGNAGTGAEPTADAFALASAAAERRKASAPRKSALPPRTQTRVAQSARASLHGGNGWHAPFGALLPLPLPGANLFLRRCRAQGSGAIAPRERVCLSAPARSAGEGDHAKHGGGGVRRRGQPRGRRPFHRASAIAGACIGVLDLKYGGQRPPMPPSLLRGAG
jgi:hypothetical protein